MAERAGFTFAFKLSGESLSLPTHNCTHGCLNSTDHIKLVIAVIVDDLKLDLLVTLEAVGGLDLIFEVRVQIVVNSLSTADLNPVFGLFTELVHSAYGIRLTEYVHVLKLAATNEQFNFLL